MQTTPDVSNSPQRQKAGIGLRCFIFLAMAVLILFIITICYRTIMVTTQLVFVRNPYTGFGMALTDVPYYTRVGTTITASAASTYGFNWFVYATDALDFIPIFYVPLAILIGLLYGLRSIGSTGLTIVLAVILAIQVAKAFYFTLYLFSLFGLHCEDMPFCVNRNIGTLASTPDTTFWVETGICYFSIIVTIGMMFLPLAYRDAVRAKNSLVPSVSYDRLFSNRLHAKRKIIQQTK